MKIEMTACNGASICLTNPAVQSPDAAHDMTNRALELFQGLMSMDNTVPIEAMMIESDDD